jgi:hypothetical protein
MKRLAMILGVFTLLLVSLSNAQQRWERTYGGSDYDGGMSVQQTTDGGYIVAGSTYSFGNECQVYLVKTNASGDTLWTKNYGEMLKEEGMSVQQTSDGGYIILGDRVNDFYLIKTNTTGDTLWTRPYGWQNWAEGRSVRQTADGGYIIAGSTYLDNRYSDQFFVVKTNASGDTLWTRSYGGSDFDRGHSVQQTFDGGYIAAGMVWSFGNQQQVYLIRFDAFGDTLWTRNYGGPYWEWGHSVQQTSETGFIIAAGTGSFGNGCQVNLIKTNAAGDTLWTRAYGGAGYDEGWSVQQTTDGGYIVAGETRSFGDSDQVYLIKTNASGDTLWTRTFGGADVDYGFCTQQTTDGGYIIAGSTWSFGDSAQVYLIKTDANGNVGIETPVRQLDGSTVRQLKVTPNPFTSFATLPGHEAERFSLYDVSGRKVGTYRGDRVGEGLAPGVYFLRYQEMLKQPMNQVQGMVQHDEIVRIVKVR